MPAPSSLDGEDSNSGEMRSQSLEVAHVGGVDDVASERSGRHHDRVNGARGLDRAERLTCCLGQRNVKRFDADPRENLLSRVRSPPPPLDDDRRRER